MRFPRIGNSLRVAGLATVLAALIAPTAAFAASHKTDADVPAHVRVRNAIRAYSALHPDDFAGINNAAVAAGSRPLTFVVEQGGKSKVVSASEYETLQSSADTSRTQLLTPSIPTDAFSVSGYWSGVSDSDGFSLSYFGSYNFRDSYGDEDDPEDAFAVQTGSMTTSCWSHEDDGAWVQSRSGQNMPAAIARKAADFDSAIFTVNDIYLSGINAVDHGTAYISYKLRRSDCDDPVYGKTYFEHNLDGCACSWSISLTIGAMSLNYSKSDPPVARQKSTTLIKYSF